MLCAVEVVWIILIVALMVGLWWFAYRMEPHWSSKDGKRFLCGAQEMQGGEPIGPRRETRVVVLPDGLLFISQKHLMRRKHSRWMIAGKSPSPPRKMHIYLAQLREDGQKIPSFLALRIPENSKCVSLLDELVAKIELSASRPAPKSAAPAAPPDQD